MSEVRSSGPRIGQLPLDIPATASGGPIAPRSGDVFFAAVQLSPVPTIITDPRQQDHPIVFANTAFSAMTGYGVDEVVGRNCRFLQGAETDPETVRDLREAIAAKRAFATEILNYRKDGYKFWNALSVTPAFDEAGELVYFFGAQFDVSRRREAEAAVWRAQKTEALGRLTGGIAHDFNNLLQVIVGYLELVRSGLGKPDIQRDRLTRNIDNARSAADRAATLTQRLLDCARTQRLEPCTLNLNDLVRAMRDLGGRTLGDDVTVETDLCASLTNCRVDRRQIETALLNVLITARDAMAGRPRKHVTIATENVVVAGSEMARSGLAPGLYAAVRVTDTGVGLPAQTVERIMDPFFTTKEEGLDNGLGLSMVYGFAKQSAGAAQIHAEDGIGTSVRIILPASDEAVPADPRAGGLALDRPGTETILIVEPRADTAELACAILKDLGYSVLTARTATEALQVSDATRDLDLLFAALVMPGEMNGVALARELRRRRGALKILLATGYIETSMERTDAGGAEFNLLDKPYGRLDLARKVRVALDSPIGAR